MNGNLISDLFFLAGAGCFFVAAWEWLVAQGAFYGISYAFRACFLGKRKKYGEKPKRGRRKTVFWRLLPFGGGCLLASALTIFLAV